MSDMREGRLRQDTTRAREEQIMFLKFLDLEFDPKKKKLYLAAHCTPTHRHPDIKDWDFYRYDQSPPKPACESRINIRSQSDALLLRHIVLMIIWPGRLSIAPMISALEWSITTTGSNAADNGKGV
jgi:hypothetical protein